MTGYRHGNSASDIWSQLERYQKLRYALLGAVAVAAAALSILSYATGALSAPERQTVDARFRIRGAEAVDNKIAIVAVDQATIRALNVRPPLPRAIYAHVLDKLRALGPRLTVLDVQFEGKTDPRDDSALVGAVARDGPVLLATNDTANGPAPVPADVSNARGAVLGSAAVDTDPDGVLRRMMYIQIRTPTLAVRTAESLLHRQVPTSAFPDNHAWVNFRGPPGTFPTYSLIDVLDGQVGARQLAGQTVLVGITDPAEKDVFTTAVSSVPMSGVEFHANALASILDGFPLKPISGMVEILLLLAFAAVPALLSLRLASVYVLAASAALVCAFLVLAQLLFDGGTIVWILDPILALVLAAVGSLAVESFAQRRSHQAVFDLLPTASDFFISYRREQSELAANTLREGLARKFGKKHVFMDTEAIDPGEEWPQRLQDAIASCRAMLVVIGPQWIEAGTPIGERRIDQPGDWVRREVEAALARPEIVVVPVTHDGAPQPSADQLPESMCRLADCQAVKLTGRAMDDWINELSHRIHSGRVRRAAGLHVSEPEASEARV